MSRLFLNRKLKLLSDKELVAEMAKDSHAAFKVIYERYWQKLLTLIIYKTSDLQISEEIVQDIFISIWNRRDVLEIEHLEAYLKRAAKLKVIDWIRKKLNQKVNIDIENVHISTEIIDYLSIEDFTLHLNKSIDNLPQKTKEIFKLSREQEFSNAEIAESLEMNIKSVEYHMTKALKQLKFELIDFLQ